MIVLNMAQKNRPVPITNKAFSLETGVLTLEISLGNYDLTGKTISAVFSLTRVETAPLTVEDGIIKLPIYYGLVKVGENKIQLNIRDGLALEQSPIMKWEVMESIVGTAPAPTQLDLTASLIAQAIEAIANSKSMYDSFVSSIGEANLLNEELESNIGAGSALIPGLSDLVDDAIAIEADLRLTTIPEAVNVESDLRLTTIPQAVSIEGVLRETTIPEAVSIEGVLRETTIPEAVNIEADLRLTTIPQAVSIEGVLRETTTPAAVAANSSLMEPVTGAVAVAEATKLGLQSLVDSVNLTDAMLRRLSTCVIDKINGRITLGFEGTVSTIKISYSESASGMTFIWPDGFVATVSIG